MEKKVISGNYHALIVSAIIFVLYAMALIFPDSFWGLHVLAFLSGGKGWILLFLGVGFTLFTQRYDIWKLFDVEASKKGDWIWIVALSSIAGIFFNQLPIFNDTYGDALVLIPNKEVSVIEFTDRYRNMLWSFDITNLKLGTETTLGLVGWISYIRESTVYEAFRFLGVTCGIGFVFFMLLSVFRLSKSKSQKILFLIMVLGTPMTLVFCGHVEIYAPVYLLLTAFCYFLIRFLEKPSALLGVFLFVLCLFNFKFHITGVITFLIFGIATLITIRKVKGNNITWKQLFAFIILPIFTGGACVYVFVTKSVFGPRSYTEDNLTDAIFLPITSSDPAPLDHYNLFSWSHFVDYFNLFFIWSAAALLIVSVVLIFRRDEVQWNRPVVQMFGVSMIIYFSVFFVLNPLLSMPTDWDLMSIPGIIFMLFAASLLVSTPNKKEESRSLASWNIAPVFALALFGWATQFVNAYSESQGQRLLAMGRYSFKTYWIGSSTPILEGMKLISEEDQQKELERLVEELAPSVVKGKDTEYAAIANRLGRFNQDELKRLDKALELYEKAFEADPLLRKNVFDLVVAYFYKREFKKANQHLPGLVAMKYPSAEKALRIAIHTALEAEDYSAAENYCTRLLDILPEDKFIQEIRSLIRTSEDKMTIKLRFSQT